MDGWIDGCMDNKTGLKILQGMVWDTLMYGWMDGWMDEWMDGWMD
jgi:hypothetical protein